MFFIACKMLWALCILPSAWEKGLGNQALECVVFLSSSLNFQCFLVCCTEITWGRCLNTGSHCGLAGRGMYVKKGSQSQHVPYIQESFSWSNCLSKVSALTQKAAGLSSQLGAGFQRVKHHSSIMFRWILVLINTMDCLTQSIFKAACFQSEIRESREWQGGRKGADASMLAGCAWLWGTATETKQMCSASSWPVKANPPHSCANSLLLSCRYLHS